ncbi:MAG TPA: DEAD/DEAH box helicase [Methanocorpusculum sp.]|nr:DEAD/DEAH box helicase [Methanocorpusculum sp.]
MRSVIENIMGGIHPKLREALYKRGFDEFSDIQIQSIPKLITGIHAILIAPTGTGKTESALIPIFHNMLVNPRQPGFTTLYITPLRSLNRDMMKRLEWWGNELGLKISVRHGDTTQSERRNQAIHPPDLLITTPESFQAMMMGKVLRKHMAGIKYVVVDEIHELAGSKRGSQLSIGLERLVEYTGDFQRIGISATVGNPDTIGKFLCGNRPYTIIQVPIAKNLDLNVKFIGDQFADQVKLIEKCVDTHTSTLLFTNTRYIAEAIGHEFQDRDDIDVHHGSLSRDMRIDAEERFRNGLTRCMICTSSMELGIDIGQIDHVIQYNSPREVSRLIQRMGRAGHSLHSVSKGIILATSFDDCIESMVIVRKAMNNEPENIQPHINATDVIANQIAALAVERGEISISKIIEILSRSYCISDCDTLIRDVIYQMERHSLIRIESDMVITKTRSRRYLSSNLSMISDEKKSVVFDVVSRKSVGTLDESFVISWVSPGSVFIVRGRMWRVLDIDDDQRILVEPTKTANGELPSWEGEQIPVPFDVAQESGKLRRLQNFDDYKSDDNVIEYSKKIIDEMIKNRSIIATDQKIVIEDSEDGVVINLCAGHKVNETLGRVISILVSARYGTSVGMETNAYRILLKLPKYVHSIDIDELLCSLDPTQIQPILVLALKKTVLYKWKLVQIAKKFGAIDVNADYRKISINRLLELFNNTVVEKEVYRELFLSNMDIPNTELIVNKIKNHIITTKTSRLSIIGGEGLFTGRDLIRPPGKDQAIIESIKSRINDQKIILVCMYCKKWVHHTKVSNIQENPVCPLCGAKLIAVLKPYDEKLLDILKKKTKTSEDRDIEQRMIRNANLVLSSGKKAIITLAGRGIGPDTAARILSTFADGDNFYREILKAERLFVQTHRYWSN